MKRISLIILSALLALTVVSCSDSRAGEEPAEEPAVTEAAEEAAPAPAEEKTEEPAEEEPVEAPAPEPENVEIVPITDLTLSKPAEIIDGTLVMYFTDEELWYKPEDECNIGMISSEMADTIKGSLDMTTYPDMFNGDDFRGAAIVPVEPIPSGSYTFSVTFGNYRVSFDMNVD